MFPPLAVVFKNNTVNNTVIITKKITIFKIISINLQKFFYWLNG